MSVSLIIRVELWLFWGWSPSWSAILITSYQGHMLSRDIIFYVWGNVCKVYHLERYSSSPVHTVCNLFGRKSLWEIHSLESAESYVLPSQGLIIYISYLKLFYLGDLSSILFHSIIFYLFSHSVICHLYQYVFEGVQNMSPQNIPLWHIDYFDLKVLEEQQVQKELSDLLFST